MRIKTVFTSIFVIIFLAGAYDADAQRRNKYKRRKTKNKSISSYRGGSIGGRFHPYYFATFNINALNYFGDLAPVNKAASTDVSFTRPGFGGNFGYKFNPRMAWRVSFNYGRVKGDDITSDPNEEQGRPRYLRNLHFRNDIKELSTGFEIYLFPNYGGPNMRPNINAYLFVGAAVFHHEPKGLVPEFDYTTGGTEPVPQAGEWVRLRPLGTEGQFALKDFVESQAGTDIDYEVKTYSPFQLSIPIAIGAKFRLPGPFDAGIEFGYRFLFTDYIDDVSGYYVGHDLFEDDLARIMADRSAEPTAAWAEVERVGVDISSQSLRDGVTYYSSTVGGGLAGIDQGIQTRRGNPDDNDMIFVTTLKLTYILGQTRTSAKFR